MEMPQRRDLQRIENRLILVFVLIVLSLGDNNNNNWIIIPYILLKNFALVGR